MNTPGNEKNPKQDIKTLKKRYDDLNKKKIRAETEKSSSERRLHELQRKARERYGTDNVEELQRLLEDMKAENERRRSEYQAHLDEIESQLQAVEEAYAKSSEAP